MCLNCPQTPEELPLDTTLYFGFGGYSVTRNGEHFFQEESDKAWEDCKKLFQIEKIAKRNSKDDWRVELFTPLRGATFQRKRGKWLCIGKNQGFA